VIALDPRRRREPRPDRRTETGTERRTRPRSNAHVDDGAGSPAGIPLRHLDGWLAQHPFEPPTRSQLDDWGVTPHLLARAEAEGRATRVGGLVLAGDALQGATEAVRRLEPGFSPGALAVELATSRRVAIALLERLDATMVTRRLLDGTRLVRRT
jgi:hypothetical protein